MGRGLKFTLIGCGGLVALFVLVGIVGAVIGGGGGSTAGSGGENAPNKPVEKQEEQAGLDKREEDDQGQQDQAQQQQDEFEQALDEAEQQQAQEEPQEEEPPAQEEDTAGVVFRVTGDQGVRFQGSIATTDVQRTVQGVTPKDYPLRGVDTGLFSNDVVSANAQKMTAGRQTLTVQIVVDGEVVKKASTSANYGVAQVSWSAAE